VPDSKLGFLLHATKIVAACGQGTTGNLNAKDRVLFNATTFGYSHSIPTHISEKAPRKSLEPVFTTESSRSGDSHDGLRVYSSTTERCPPPIVSPETKESHQKLEPLSPDTMVNSEPATFTLVENLNSPLRDGNSESTEDTLNSQASRETPPSPSQSSNNSESASPSSTVTCCPLSDSKGGKASQPRGNCVDVGTRK
jgi:hypothetical protein